MPFGLQGTVVLFLGHETSEETCAAFQHLRTTAGSGVAVCWLLDVAGGAEPLAEYLAETHTYDSRRFAQQGLATFGPTMLSGHCHFPVLDFYLRNPRITRLWVVECDVRFTGPWSKFFALMVRSDADLLTCHLRTAEQEPGWYWWNTLRNPSGQQPKDVKAFRAFLVVARCSARALDMLIASHRAGWCGHQEVIIPTLVARAAMSMCDINEIAELSRGTRVDTSIEDLRGSLEALGTLRFHPARHRAGFRREMLYQPVKSKSSIAPKSLPQRMVR
jgi:hypothetical protein